MSREATSSKSIAISEHLEIAKLREAAKIASIYHGNGHGFRRNPRLSHLTHASLHCSQFIVASVIEIFHHTHHFLVKNRRLQDETVPILPEERNPIFYIYPICMTISILLAIFWGRKWVIAETPEIGLVGCFGSAILILLAGIMEMKHADLHIDITTLSDAELLVHPIFVHNFVMCILSIFCMTLYLVQGWILVDYVQWIKKQESSSEVSNDLQASQSSSDSVIIEEPKPRGKIGHRESRVKEEPGELDPIPTLANFPSMRRISHEMSVEEEPVVFYCCFVDCFNYIKSQLSESGPVHEFQVIHVM